MLIRFISSQHCCLLVSYCTMRTVINGPYPGTRTHVKNVIYRFTLVEGAEIQFGVIRQ
jgi:hypothetical protein